MFELEDHCHATLHQEWNLLCTLAVILHSPTEGPCGLCALYSEVDLPCWVKAVANGPTVDTHEEVHAVVQCVCTEEHGDLLMVQVEELA